MSAQQNLNLENYWLPFTPNKKFKANPRLLVSAKGMHYKVITEDQIFRNNKKRKPTQRKPKRK